MEPSCSDSPVRDSSSLDPIFLSHLRQLWDPDEPHFLADLLVTFTADADGRLRAMRRALADGDVAALTRAAHALKGASSAIGARDVAEICQRLMEYHDRPWTAQTGMLVRQVERAVSRLKADVERLDVMAYCS